jgi:hypothetical protein
MTATPLDLALAYLARGFAVIPVPFRKKKPAIDGWQRLRLTAESAPSYFNGGPQNVGILLGPASRGLTDIDLDCAEAVRLAPDFLPVTEATFGRASKRTSHWEYRTDLADTDKRASIAFREPKTLSSNGKPNMLLELRIGGGDKGAQTVFPGSTHESGEEILWERHGEPATISGAELLRSATLTAAAALLVRHYPHEGARHEAVGLVLGGLLAREGWTSDAIASFVSSVVRCANDPEGRERVRSAAGAVERLAKGEPTSGFPRMTELWGADVSRLFAAWLCKRSHSVRKADPAIGLEDFYAYMPMHSYIFVPSRELWPGGSINARIEPQPLADEAGNPICDEGDKPKRISASQWLDQNRAVEQMTWAPGEPEIVEDRLVSQGGWINKPGCHIFNLYRPPIIIPGDARKADAWRNHVAKVFPENASHITRWLAHRLQRPEDKINHALVLGGPQGIGKDSLLEPVKYGVGPWNFAEISPKQLTEAFNEFTKSVILRISEARDLGDVDRYGFYEQLKVYTAAPPDVLRVNEKHVRAYNVFNCCGVIVTTNHKTDGLYLPADDRRHYVAWSDLTKDSFTPEYWTELWDWYAVGGINHTVAYLLDFDLSGFDPKAPPPKTEAWWAIVNASRAPEDAELADALDKLDNPNAVTLAEIADKAEPGLAEFIRDRKNSRIIPHRMEACGYVALRNPSADSGLWVIKKRRQIVYVKSHLSVQAQYFAKTTRYG